MEVRGAALATVIARVIEVVWRALETIKKDSVKLRLRYAAETDRRLRKDFWKYTAPALGNEIVWGGGCSQNAHSRPKLRRDAIDEAEHLSRYHLQGLKIPVSMGFGGVPVKSRQWTLHHSGRKFLLMIL